MIRRAMVVVASFLALVGCSQSGAESPRPTASPTLASPAPIDLRVKARDTSVELRWDAEPGTGQAIEIVRNGELVDFVKGSPYVDESMPFDTPLRYVVRLKNIGSKEPVGESEEVTVKLAEPPAEDARLEGDYQVKLTITEATSGWEEPIEQGDKKTLWFRLKPTCPQGICDVEALSRSFNKPVRFTLTPTGKGGYEGSGSFPGWYCQDGRLASTGEFAAQVDRGHLTDDGWVVRSGTGTLDISFPGNERCSGSFSADFEIKD